MDDITKHTNPGGSNDPNIETGPHGAHEIRDVNVSAVAKFVAAVVAMTLATMLMFYLTFDQVAGLIAPKSGQRPAMADADPLKQPPEPRLQANEPPDLARFHKGEEAILDHYGWVDPDKGVVRIPVERALELVAKEGLPSRGQEGAKTASAAAKTATTGAAKK